MFCACSVLIGQALGLTKKGQKGKLLKKNKYFFPARQIGYCFSEESFQ